MVGFVIVSHSENLAKSVVELTSIMAPSARIAPAGGMDDGGFGTSFEKIQAASMPATFTIVPNPAISLILPVPCSFRLL